MAIPNYPMDLAFPILSVSDCAIAHLVSTIEPSTRILIGTCYNVCDYFMSNSHSQLGYYAWLFQAIQQIVLIMFSDVD